MNLRLSVPWSQPMWGSRSDADQSPQVSEYQQLQDQLVVTTIVSSVLITGAVAFFYGFNLAANYLLGAVVGVVYLRMLGRAVARLGPTHKRLGVARLGIFLVLMVLAIQLKSLHIIPVFLGFLTYKVALIVYMFQVLTRPWRQSPRSSSSV